MRLVILTLLFHLFTSSTEAQDFLLKSSKWRYVNNGGLAPPNSLLKTYTYQKDTLVLGKTSQVLSNGFIFHSRNDSVFYYDSLYLNFGLIYDYNANKGDTVESQVPGKLQHTSNTFKSIVTNVLYEVFPSGDSLRKFELNSLDATIQFKSQCYYERIGALEFLPVKTASIPEHFVIKCYSDSTVDAQLSYLHYSCDSLISGIEDLSYEKTWFGMRPNPVIDEIELSNFSGIFNEYAIYSIEGRLVKSGSVKYNNVQGLSDLQSGIYLLSVFSASSDDAKSYRFVKE